MKTNMRRAVGIAGGIALSALLSTLPAGATVQDVGGAVNVLAEPPTDVRLDALTSDTNAFVFVEQACATLASGLGVDVLNPAGTYGDASTQPGVIPTGTKVDSYYVHIDQVQTAGVRSISGTLTFDRPVLGLIFLTHTLNATDAALGASGTTYPQVSDTAARGYDAPDAVQVSADGLTVTFSTTIAQYQDELRIITEGTCEPATLEQCKNGGWGTYAFKNQGQCVSFVATNGRHGEAAAF